MERKIGEIFEYNGEWYQCVECDSCGECSLRTTECGSGTKSDLADEVFGQCSKIRRSDYKHIIFKKLEKVGEPIVYMNKTLQRLKSLDDYCCKYCYFRNKTCNSKLCEEKLFLVEIKKAEKDMKEYMEEYKMHDAKEDIPEFDNVVDECLFGKQKLKLKPFDLQKAKEGKSVCTRNRRSARIVCFDRVTNTTNEYTGRLIVLVTNPNGDEQSFYYTEKGNRAGNDEYDNHKWDLMMLPEKKEGWVNVYKHFIYKTKEEAQSNINPDNELIDTIKIEWEE